MHLSILDLATISRGVTATKALQGSVTLAQHAEAWGYRRYWFAEHHNMANIASSSPAILIGHIAAHTKHIRVGSGGVMLPNHSPLLIAEQFGTLDALFPGRIDLGLGRAPGTDMQTVHALRRDVSASDRFPQDIQELQRYFGEKQPGQEIIAVPATGRNVPLYILGSSLFGAQLAATMGLPYAFASHFAPDELLRASELYRREFQPSAQLDAPYMIAALNVYAADTQEEGEALRQANLVRMAKSLAGRTTMNLDELPDEVLLNSPVGQHAQHMFQFTAAGTGEVVASQVEAFRETAQANEIMVVTNTSDLDARLRSYEILSQRFGAQLENTTM